MFDMGWTEILVIGVVALIVIGPRDLPAALHTFGKYVGKMRTMVRDFQSGIDEIARQQELRELQKSVRDVTSAPKRVIENSIADWEKAEGKEAAPPDAAVENTANSDAKAEAFAETRTASAPPGPLPEPDALSPPEPAASDAASERGQPEEKRGPTQTS
jgi:sec-independent protein translocase protein TatB